MARCNSHSMELMQSRPQDVSPHPVPPRHVQQTLQHITEESCSMCADVSYHTSMLLSVLVTSCACRYRRRCQTTQTGAGR